MKAAKLQEKPSVRLLKLAMDAEDHQRHDEAEMLYRRVIKLDRDNFAALLNLSNIYIANRRFDEAEIHLTHLLKITKGEQKQVLNSLATVYQRQEKYHQAEALLNKALALDPHYTFALNNMSACQQLMGHTEQALQFAFQAISSNIKSAHGFNNLGSAYAHLAQFAEATIAFQTAIDLDPNFIEPVINLGSMLAHNKQHVEAIAVYQTALQKIGHHLGDYEGLIRFFMSYSQLAVGQIAEGWKNFEHGFNPLNTKGNARRPKRQFTVPQWTGQPLDDKTVLIWREQGLGDEILFMSCLNDLVPDLSRVIIECDPRMVELFKRSFPAALVRPAAYQPNLNALYADFDYHLPMGSMMKFNRNALPDFARSNPFLRPDPDKQAYHQERVREMTGDRLAIGICWRSGLIDPLRKIHYAELDEFAPLFANKNLAFVNLQYDDCEVELKAAEARYGIQFIRPTIDLKNDLDDLAALIRGLDCVVTAGTAVSMMSGAVGTQTIEFGLSGKWTKLGTDHFPWFPNLEIIDGRREDYGAILTAIADYFAHLPAPANAIP